MSVKKSLKAGIKGAYDPIGATKDSIGIAKRDLVSKPPGQDPDIAAAEELARQRQFEQLAALDEQENRRIKTLLSASRGARMYRGSPLTRSAPGNRSGGAVGGFGAGAIGAAAAVASSSVSGGGSGGGSRGGSRGGGGARRAGSLIN